MSEERRHHDRYAMEQLVLNVTRPGIKGFLQLSPTADCLNFSLSGLQFLCQKPMKPGEPLILDLCFFDINLTEIYGEIVSCEQQESGAWRCGLRFCFEDKRMQRHDVSQCLLEIEHKLRALDEYPPATQEHSLS